MLQHQGCHRCSATGGQGPRRCPPGGGGGSAAPSEIGGGRQRGQSQADGRVPEQGVRKTPPQVRCREMFSGCVGQTSAPAPFSWPSDEGRTCSCSATRSRTSLVAEHICAGHWWCWGFKSMAVREVGGDVAETACVFENCNMRSCRTMQPVSEGISKRESLIASLPPSCDYHNTSQSPKFKMQRSKPRRVLLPWPDGGNFFPY